MVNTPPEADVVRGEQQAPRERVDGRAADQRVAVEVAVEGGEVAQVGEEHEQHRHLVEELGEARRRRAALAANSGARARAAASASRSVTAANGVSPASICGRYSYQPGR